MRLGLAPLTRATHPPGRDALRERPFDPGTSTVAFPESWRLLSFSGFLQGQILLFGPQAHLTSTGLGTSAERLRRTHFTLHALQSERRITVGTSYHERCSQRGVCRIFGISRETLAGWLKKAALLPPLRTTLVPALPGDVLELDELWSFVRQCKNKRWIWLAQCRRTRQVIAYAIGRRGRRTCRVLWRRIQVAYKTGLLFTDFWSAYAEALPPGQHRAAGKSEGQTCHIERFNNILRQRMGRLVRKTL